MSRTPGYLEYFVRGLTAGVVSAGFNLLYFFVYVGVTRVSVREPTWASIAVSSLVPCLLAAAGYAWLARRTPRAGVYFWLLVGAIVVASFEGIFRTTLPDGSLKPAGFDGLVMPMHVVVGLTAALVIPSSVGASFGRWTSLRLPCVRWQ